MKFEESQFNTALDRAMARGVLPSSLGSAAQRKAFSRSLRRAMVFSAKVANADFLNGVYEEINKVLEGGYDNDVPMARLRLKLLLQRLQYSPDVGFPGDEALGIEPVEPGSLQDLSSDARLNLIIETQTGLMRGLVQREQDHDPIAMKMFPWWELVRVEHRRVPRGSPDSGSLGWPARWVKARGPAPVVVEGKTRLIAAKDHPVWFNLGDSSLFEDALDVDFPPFAFRSGWGVRNIHWREGRAFDLELPEYAKPDYRGTPKREDLPANVVLFPMPMASVKRMEPDVLAEMEAALADSLGGQPIKSTSDILSMGGVN